MALHSGITSWQALKIIWDAEIEPSQQYKHPTWCTTTLAPQIQFENIF